MSRAKTDGRAMAKARASYVLELARGCSYRRHRRLADNVAEEVAYGAQGNRCETHWQIQLANISPCGQCGPGGVLARGEAASLNTSITGCEQRRCGARAASSFFFERCHH
ncbi:hypothetical protein P3T21_007457 [Paraburkholderia sp. GAS334]